jgi:hypothetical protein
MSRWRFGGAAAALLLVLPGLGLANPEPLPEPAIPPMPALLQQLQGEWALGIGVTAASACEPQNRRHRYEVADGGRLLIERPQPRAGVAPPDGEVRRYRVLFGDARRVALYHEQETFIDTSTGDPPIRQLILDEPDRLGVRLLGKPPEWRAAAVLFRCAR